MDLQEATLTMALLFKKEMDFHREHIKGKEGPVLEDVLREYEVIRANTREFGNRLAAIPDFFDVMESWKVNVSGKDGVSLESLNMAAKNGNVDDLIDKTGSLAQSVKDYMREEGHVMAGIGVGEDGWDIGVLCTEKKSRDLCTDLHQKYCTAVEYGLLRVSRRFAGHSLPGMYGWDEAERLLRAYGDDIPTL